MVSNRDWSKLFEDIDLYNSYFNFIFLSKMFIKMNFFYIGLESSFEPNLHKEFEK